MKRIALAASLAACFGLFAAPVRADDTILRRNPVNAGKDVNVSGTIQEETPAGVKIKVGANSQVIPPDDIRYIGYDVSSLPEVDPLAFGNLHGKEEQALAEPADQRQKDLVEVAAGYAKLEKQLKKAPNALRYVQYRSAMLVVNQAKDDPSKATAATDALKAYLSSNSGGWEVVPATKTAARLLEESGDKPGAIAVYNDLTKNPDVPPAIQLSTNLLVARMLMRDGKYAGPDGAQKKLETVLAGTTDEKQKGYLEVYLAETQVAQGNVQGVEDKLNGVIKGAAGDDNLKALAYNTLGDSYQQAKHPDDAFWQYLRVDVLYNQDREEHARALYNLWKLFDSVRADAARSKECLDRLKDKSLAGTEYQARAVKETGGGDKAP